MKSSSDRDNDNYFHYVIEPSKNSRLRNYAILSSGRPEIIMIVTIVVIITSLYEMPAASQLR
jgi:hypothetical protein